MKDLLDVRNICIPDGVLHDQKLKSAKFSNGELTLEFDVKIYEQDYTDKVYFEKYKNYKSCFVKAKVDDTSCCMFYGNKKDKITGKYAGLNEFVDYINNAQVSAQYYDTLTCGAFEIKIELIIYGHKSKSLKYRKYKKFSNAILVLDTDKLTFEWE